MDLKEAPPKSTKRWSSRPWDQLNASVQSLSTRSHTERTCSAAALQFGLLFTSCHHGNPTGGNVGGRTAIIISFVQSGLPLASAVPSPSGQLLWSSTQTWTSNPNLTLVPLLSWVINWTIRATDWPVFKPDSQVKAVWKARRSQNCDLMIPAVAFFMWKWVFPAALRSSLQSPKSRPSGLDARTEPCHWDPPAE